MKKTLSALLLSVMLLVLLPAAAMAAGAGIAVDSSNFPDANFRSYVAESCDTDQDGFLSEAEIAEVTYVDVNQREIADLTGIEFFTALEGLDCSSNYLTSLDVSANTSLSYLDCCFNQLKSLDISETIQELFCINNQLTSLDVSANAGLYWILANGNHLTHLVLCDTQAIMESSFSDQTVAIELEQKGGEYRLDFASLVGAENTGRVTVTAVTPADASYTVRDGVLSSDTELTSISYAYSLGQPEDYLAMDVTLLNMVCIPLPKDTLAIDERIFPDASFRRYIADRHDANHDGFLSPEERLSVLNIDVTSMGIMNWSGMEIEDLTGIQHFPALTTLICNCNQLTSLDVSVNTALTKLECSENHLTSLDVSANTALTKLQCTDNILTSLDVSGCPDLCYLNCSGNLLTSLNVRANTSLTYLDGSYNQLTSLDLSANTMLISEYDYYSFVSNQHTAAAMTETNRTYRLDFADLVGAENVDRITVTAVEPADVPYSVQDGVLTTERALTSLMYEYDYSGPYIGTMDVTLDLH